MGAFDLPSELCDKVSSFVDSREDVLSLALSCKQLCSIVSHTHLQYRDIRCQIYTTDLWSKLAHPDDLHAEQVRSLTILPFDWDQLRALFPGSAPQRRLQERLPLDYGVGRVDSPGHEAGMDRTGITRDLFCVWEKAFVTALKRMTNLKRFCWLQTQSPVVLGEYGEYHVWSVLRNLGTVRELYIVDADSKWSESEPETTFSVLHLLSRDSLQLHKHLTSLIVRSDVSPRDSDIPLVTSPLFEMLRYDCPDLEELELRLERVSEPIDISTLLATAEWPHLRTLRLHGFKCSLKPLRRFLSFHDKLEDLEVPKDVLELTSKKPLLTGSALPHLRHLTCKNNVGFAILSNPSIAPNIQSLRGINLYDIFIPGVADPEGEGPWSDLSRWSRLMGCIQARKSIVAIHCNIGPVSPQLLGLSKVAPQLKTIGIRWPWFRGRLAPSEWQNMYRAFSQFPRLEEVIWECRLQPGQIPFGDGDDAGSCSRRVREIGTLCPSLKALSDARLKYVITGRNGDQSLEWVIRDADDSNEPFISGKEETIYAT